MNIYDYITLGGKNLIKEYISTRPMHTVFERVNN